MTILERTTIRWTARTRNAGRFFALLVATVVLSFAAVSDVSAQSRVWSKARSARNASASTVVQNRPVESAVVSNASETRSAFAPSSTRAFPGRDASSVGTTTRRTNPNPTPNPKANAASRVAQDVVRLAPTTATGGERSVPAASVDLQAAANRPVGAPESFVGEPIARRASKEEAKKIARSPAPKGVFYAILPRANLLKETPRLESGSESDSGSGADGATRVDVANDTNAGPDVSSVPEGQGFDALVDSARERIAKIAETSAEANADETLEPYMREDADAAPDDAIVFTLTNLSPDELVLLRDAPNGRWDKMDLFNAALIAEGLTTRELRAPYRRKFERCVADVAEAAKAFDDDLAKAEIVYRYLHRNVLTSNYSFNCSSLVASLDTGVFNCVSATTLFNCLASRIGLDVAALETVGHAKSRIKFGDSFLDVETTCSDWSRLPDGIRKYPASAKRSAARPVSGSDGSATRIYMGPGSRTFDSRSVVGSTTFEERPDAPFGYSFTRSRRPMREIGEVELVATIYYNVGVELYQRQRFEEAVAAYVKAARLAPNNLTILGNLKATLNNWAVQIAVRDRDFERAIRITEQGLSVDPNFVEFRQNLPIFYRRWTSFLAKDNRWEDVERVRAQFYARFPEEERRERERREN